MADRKYGLPVEARVHCSVVLELTIFVCDTATNENRPPVRELLKPFWLDMYAPRSLAWLCNLRSLLGFFFCLLPEFILGLYWYWIAYNVM